MVNPNHSVSHGTTLPCSDGEAGKRRPVHPPISAMAGDTGGDFIEYGHSENILGLLVVEHCLPSLGFTFFSVVPYISSNTAEAFSTLAR